MANPPGIGDRAHGFELSDHAGEKRDLAELIHKGKVVLVFFRGTW